MRASRHARTERVGSLTEAPDLSVHNGGVDIAYLRMQGVAKGFSRGNETVLALRDVNLEVRRGEFVAVMGPSGSGKSTLLQLAGGLDVPSAGVVWVAGTDLGALSEAALARFRLQMVGFVFQAFNLIGTLDALENAALPLVLAGQPRRMATERAAALLEQLGLGARTRHLPGELSGGEAQRVCMARAMVGRPPLLLADEPTGSLDTHAGEEVMRLLRRVPGELGQTVLMVTHDARAAAYADRVVSLRDGRLGEGTRAPLPLP